VIVPNGPQGETDPADQSRNHDLRWAETALFDTPSHVLNHESGPSTRSATTSWTALPARGPLRRLVPASARFAAEAFANDHDAMSTTRRAMGRAARLSVRSGTLRFAPKLYADTTTVFHDPASSVIAAAADALGRPIAAAAITLGPRRYNRKPVVQLMNAAAETVGYLKVGASPLTSAMVATEAATVDRLCPTSAILRVPTVLWRSRWHGCEVACFSSVAVRAAELVAADPSRLVEIALAVVQAGGGQHDHTLRDCVPFTRVRSAAGSNSDIQKLIDTAAEVFGDRTVSVGSWHGDFSPWNMISTADSTALIDWEFADDAMAIGADLLHNRVMTATHLRGEAPWRPLRVLLDAGDDVPELHAMAVPSHQHRPHLLLYLLELMRRDLELQRHNQPDTGFGVSAQAAAQAILADAVR